MTGPSFARHFLADAEAEREAEAARARVFAEIARLDLDPQAAELDRDGYTVLRPERVAAPQFIRQLRDAVLADAERRTGVSVDVASGKEQAGMKSPFGSVQFDPFLLGEDPVFESALMNEQVLALITYLLGESCVLCHMTGMIKGPGPDYLPLHADQNQNGAPAPFPAYAQVANATWALTDYSRDNGAICFVPGSHKLCRHPTAAESADLSLYKPLEVPAGSVIIWHGNTWHGAVPRTAPGVRISLVEYFNRWYHLPIEGMKARVTPAMLERNPPRFSVITGAVIPALAESDQPRGKAIRIGLYA